MADPEKRLGTVTKNKHGQWQGIITLTDGSRKRLKAFPKGTSEAMARERTHVAALKAREHGAKKIGAVAAIEAGEKWWDDYFKLREAKGLSPVEFRYNPHIAPVLAGKHPKDWTREDCERVVAALDAKIAAGEISWKTGANVWGLFTKACKVACSAKSGALRVRSDNPCLGVEAPDRGEKKAKQWLFPDEFSQLMACERVPLRWRQLYAILAYTYVRPNELRALNWPDVNLEMGTFYISRAWDQKRRRLKSPKTRAGIRHVPLEPTLMPLLRAMRPASGQGPLIDPGPMEDWAARFRKHLAWAGVDRAELFVTDATHKQITLYDLRASGITWRCLRKDYGPEIQQAAGHEKYDTTDGYIRTARVFLGRVSEPFPALPEALSDHPPRSPEAQVLDIVVTPARIELALPA